MTNTGRDSGSDSGSEPEAEGRLLNPQLYPPTLKLTLKVGSYNPRSFSIPLRSNEATILVLYVYLLKESVQKFGSTEGPLSGPRKLLIP